MFSGDTEISLFCKISIQEKKTKIKLFQRLMIQCFKHAIRLEKEIQVIQVILGHLQYTDIHENQHYNNVADVVEIHTIGKRNRKRNNKIFRKKPTHETRRKYGGMCTIG